MKIKYIGMLRFFSFILYNILYFFEKILRIFFRKSFLVWFKEFLHKDSYITKNILGKKVIFFTPNALTEHRVRKIFTKEPETIEWIDGFKKKKNLIFWDIGSNIGLFSIYNVLKNRTSTSISFEPSSSNIRVLTRNISINKLEKKIKVITLPLTNKENTFQVMNENDFLEGGALNAFGVKFDHEGKRYDPKMKYSLLGTSLNNLIKNKALKIPDYVKIDVDGLEHLILEGGSNVFNKKKIKSISIEINENFNSQFYKVLKYMKKFGYEILQKRQNKKHIGQNIKFTKTFNYVFIRK